MTDTRVLMRAMQYAATFGFRVWLQPQDAHLQRAVSPMTAQWRRDWVFPASR